MDFGLNRFQHHHLQPRGLDLIMTDAAPQSGFEDEAAAGRGDSDNDHVSGSCSEREHMFDKVVTPSDVGKLNRLVIPKQHAERYFPLDSSTNEKGLLLNFEDRNGKSWRFRYSYWNRSQRYVMTKGWSRFVKEKRLEAGDIVSFQRGVGEVGRDRLYIDWRHRPEAPTEYSTALRHNLVQLPTHGQLSCRPTVVPAWSSLVWRPLGAATPYAPPIPRDHLHLSPLNNNTTIFDWNNSYSGSGGCSYGYGSVVKPESAESAVFYLRSGMVGGGGGGAPQLAEGQEFGILRQRQPHEEAALSTSGTDDDHHLPQAAASVVYESVPVVVHGNLRTPKRSCLRLFGVNMECPISSAQDSTDECDLFLSSSNTTGATTSSIPHHLSASSATQSPRRRPSN